MPRINIFYFLYYFFLGDDNDDRQKYSHSQLFLLLEGAFEDLSWGSELVEAWTKRCSPSTPSELEGAFNAMGSK